MLNSICNIKPSEDEGSVADWATKLDESRGHRLKEVEGLCDQLQPLFDGQNSVESSKARDSLWPRNLFSKKIQET